MQKDPWMRNWQKIKVRAEIILSFLRLGHHSSIWTDLIWIKVLQISVNVLPNHNRHIRDSKRATNGPMSGCGGNNNPPVPCAYQSTLSDMLNMKIKLDIKVYLQCCVGDTELQTSGILCGSFSIFPDIS